MQNKFLNPRFHESLSLSAGSHTARAEAYLVPLRISTSPKNRGGRTVDVQYMFTEWESDAACSPGLRAVRMCALGRAHILDLESLTCL